MSGARLCLIYINAAPQFVDFRIHSVTTACWMAASASTGLRLRGIGAIGIISDHSHRTDSRGSPFI